MSSKRIPRVCRNCNAAFLIYPYQAANGRYCSRRCADAGKKLDSTDLAKIGERFWSNVERRRPEECWLWTGSDGGNGYGSFGWGGRCTARGTARTASAHRFALAFVAGLIGADLRITTDQHALHSCDNRKCCNPAHLRWGTNLENIQDRVDRDRTPKGSTHHSFLRPETVSRGERTHKARLTANDVYAIRLRYARGGVSQYELSREYGVARTSIADIIQRRSWKHVV